MRALTIDELYFVSGGTQQQPPPREVESVVVTGTNLGSYFSGFSMPQFGVQNVWGGGSYSVTLDLSFDLDQFIENLGSNQTAGQAIMSFGMATGHIQQTSVPGGTLSVVPVANWTFNIITAPGGSHTQVTWNTGGSNNYIFVPGSGPQPWPGPVVPYTR